MWSQHPLKWDGGWRLRWEAKSLVKELNALSGQDILDMNLDFTRFLIAEEQLERPSNGFES